MAEIPKLTTRRATGAGIKEGTMHKASGDYARSALPGQEPTRETMGITEVMGGAESKDSFVKGIRPGAERKASLFGDSYSNRGSVSSISVSPRNSNTGGGSAQNLIMTGHQGDSNGRGYLTSIQAEAESGAIHSPAEMYSSAKNMESLTFSPVTRQMADNPSSVSDAFRQFNTGALGGSNAINNSANPAAGRQSGAEIPSNITPEQHAAYVKDIEERAKKVDPKDVKKTVSRFLGGMQTQIDVDSAEDFFAHAQAVHDFLAPEPELQRQFGYSLNTTNPDASISLVGATKNFENEYRPIQDKNVEKNNNKAKVSAEDKVDIKAAVKDLEEGKHIGAGAGMGRRDFSPSPMHEVSPPGARKMRLEGAGDTPNAAEKVATPAAAAATPSPPPSPPAPSVTAPASAKIPQASDAPAEAAQKLASTESVPTAAPSASPVSKATDTATPSQAAAPNQNSARQAAEELRAKAAESRQATSAPAAPARPASPGLSAAEIAENERRTAQAAYERLSKSDNPAHRAMAEKAKARAEGGRVVREGQDVGTAAEQAGSKIPQVSDSPGTAAQKLASTESVPSAPSSASRPTSGSAAARTSAASPPSGGGSSPTGELARRQQGTLDRYRPEYAASESEIRQARATARATGGAPGSPSGGAAPPGGGGAAPPRPTHPRVSSADDLAASAAEMAQRREAQMARAAGKATKGNRVDGVFKATVYNSSLIDRELDLTTRGFVAGIGSIANDLGLNRRATAYGADGTPSSYMDTFFGTTIRGGTGYAHPFMDEAGRVSWKTAADVKTATAGWGKHIEDSFQKSTGLMKGLTGARRSIFNALGGAEGNFNKILTRLGGAGTLVAPALMGITAISDFREGYRKGGIFGGVAGAGKGVISGWVTNKIVSAALLNPVPALIAGTAIAAAAYSTYKIFDVRNQGNNYLRQRQMQGPSWKTGPSAGMNSAMGNTIRQRSISAMENSRFNSMRSMGNESYMINAPKSRYANSTTIHSTGQMLSY